MRRQVEVHRVGLYAAWVKVVGGAAKLVVVPKELVKRPHDPDGPQPGDQIRVVLPGWVEEAAEVE